MIEEAIHAGGDAIFKSHQKLKKRPEVKETIDRKKRLARLYRSRDFKEFLTIVDSWISNLKKAPMQSSNDSIEAIGYRYLASSLTIEYLQLIESVPKRYYEQEKRKNEKEERKVQ